MGKCITLLGFNNVQCLENLYSTIVNDFEREKNVVV